MNNGAEISIKFTATDSSGIARVELLVDGASVKTETIQPVGTFAGVQKWKAALGAHAVGIRAYNPAGTASEPVTVSLNVVQNTPTPAVSATHGNGNPCPFADAWREREFAQFIQRGACQDQGVSREVTPDVSRQDDPYRIIEVILLDRFCQI